VVWPGISRCRAEVRPSGPGGAGMRRPDPPSLRRFAAGACSASSNNPFLSARPHVHEFLGPCFAMSELRLQKRPQPQTGAALKKPIWRGCGIDLGCRCTKRRLRERILPFLRGAGGRGGLGGQSALGGGGATPAGRRNRAARYWHGPEGAELPGLQSPFSRRAMPSAVGLSRALVVVAFIVSRFD
jgi:hypothetical protein